MAHRSLAGEDPASVPEKTPSRPPRNRRPHPNEIYAHPLPLTIYPSPAFIAHNPLSVLQVLWHSVSLWWSQASSHPAVRYKARLSVESQSVHVTDPATVRLLWTHGFFGKGSLSRSEPSWLEREKRRRGLAAGQTSEDITRKRRAERKEFKKERAKKEREAIEKQLQSEGQGNASVAADVINVDDIRPHEEQSSNHDRFGHEDRGETALMENGNNPIEDALNHQPAALVETSSIKATSTGDKETAVIPQREARVQFPTEKLPNGRTSNDSKPRATGLLSERASAPQGSIADQEHLQLTPEEAFFLVYALGILEVLDPDTQEPLPSPSLFQLFRRWSYFPARPSNYLQPDDPFLLSYVVYHHFRSLGWVVRSGVKFGVNYLLYNRGPVFAHAEFAAIIMPSYSDSYYANCSEGHGKSGRKERKPWEWLHCVNRVQSQVRKSLLLVYVEVPAPGEGSLDRPEDIGRMLKRFTIREVNIKRWTPNRTRD